MRVRLYVLSGECRATQLFSTHPESAQAVTNEVQPAKPDDRSAGVPAVAGMGRYADLALVDETKATKLAVNQRHPRRWSAWLARGTMLDIALLAMALLLLGD